MKLHARLLCYNYVYVLLLCRLEPHEVPRRIKDNNVMDVLLCNPQQVRLYNYGIESFCVVTYCLKSLVL